MWPQVTLTIAYRGILVIHRVETVQPNYYEIGVVPADHHFLRIHTMKNGVLAATDFLQVDGNRKKWSLVVDYPVGLGVAPYKSGTFNRLNHSTENDYRWLTELGDLFEDLPNKVDTSKFSPIVNIPYGIFYTRLKSPVLSKVTNDQAREFGSIAAVVACDIPMLGGQARLIEQDGGKVLFTFEPDENTIYEFANTPCDVPEHVAVNHEDPDPERHHEMLDPCEGNHFKMYYNILRDPDAEPSICFIKPGPRPAPDPALCGAAGADRIKDPFSNP